MQPLVVYEVPLYHVTFSSFSVSQPVGITYRNRSSPELVACVRSFTRTMPVAFCPKYGYANESVPLAACVSYASPALMYEPDGMLSSTHTVPPLGIDGVDAVTGVQPTPSVPTWSNHTRPP